VSQWGFYAAQQSGSDDEKRPVLEQLEFLAKMRATRQGPQMLTIRLRELAERLRTKWRL
jgi:hypothetical protein